MMRDQQTTRSRTRFARLYSDGGMGLAPAGTEFVQARRELIESSDDPDVELLEVEVTVIRSHGLPKLHAIKEHRCTCPTCGETVYIEVPNHL